MDESWKFVTIVALVRAAFFLRDYQGHRYVLFLKHNLKRLGSQLHAAVYDKVRHLYRYCLEKQPIWGELAYRVKLILQRLDNRPTK